MKNTSFLNDICAHDDLMLHLKVHFLLDPEHVWSLAASETHVSSFPKQLTPRMFLQLSDMLFKMLKSLRGHGYAHTRISTKNIVVTQHGFKLARPSGIRLSKTAHPEHVARFLLKLLSQHKLGASMDSRFVKLLTDVAKAPMHGGNQEDMNVPLLTTSKPGCPDEMPAVSEILTQVTKLMKDALFDVKEKIKRRNPADAYIVDAGTQTEPESKQQPPEMVPQETDKEKQNEREQGPRMINQTS